MRRRSFLKLLGLAGVWASSAGASGALAAVAQPPTLSSAAPLASTALRYRADGSRIYVSSNNGKSWTLHTYLGPDYSIQRLATDRSGVHLTVGFRGRTFDLNLASNLRSWLTA
jgi:predicted acyl esterase